MKISPNPPQQNEEIISLYKPGQPYYYKSIDHRPIYGILDVTQVSKRQGAYVPWKKSFFKRAIIFATGINYTRAL